MNQPLAVVELDPAGHRLAYVRAVVDETCRSGAAVRVVTTPDAWQSAEWHEHIGDVDASVDVRLEQPPRSAWQFARADPALEPVRGARLRCTPSGAHPLSPDRRAVRDARHPSPHPEARSTMAIALARQDDALPDPARPRRERPAARVTVHDGAPVGGDRDPGVPPASVGRRPAIDSAAVVGHAPTLGRCSTSTRTHGCG